MARHIGPWRTALLSVAFVTTIAIIQLRRRLASQRSRIHPIDD